MLPPNHPSIHLTHFCYCITAPGTITMAYTTVVFITPFLNPDGDDFCLLFSPQSHPFRGHHVERFHHLFHANMQQQLPTFWNSISKPGMINGLTQVIVPGWRRRPRNMQFRLCQVGLTTLLWTIWAYFFAALLHLCNVKRV